MKRFIVLAIVVLVMGLSLLAIQCNPDSNKLPKEGLQGIDKQIKMPLKGFY